MRCLVLYYAYDGDPEYADPIALIPDVVLENIDEGEEERIFGRAKADYNAPDEHCRTAWVVMPDASHLFGTPTLGAARLADE